MSNTLTTVIPQILAKGLLALRQNAIMPRLVNTDYGLDAQNKGASITVPIPAAISAKAVTPSSTPGTSADFTTGSATITLNKWYETAFTLSDKDILEAHSMVIPMQISEAIKGLANQVDADILALYKDIYGKAGTAHTDPFGSSTSDITTTRKVLTNQLCPVSDRRVVMNADAEANALGLRQFQDINMGQSLDDILKGNLTRKLGFDWFVDQNIPDHTVGTFGGTDVSPTHTNGAGNDVGSTTLSVHAGATNGVALKDGDIFTIAGDSQTYAVVGNTTVAATETGNVTIAPALKVEPADGTALTIEGTPGSTYAVNLAFHPNCIAFASRPLRDVSFANPNILAMTDDVTGLTLRLELTRQNRQDRWAFDILYGCAVVRPQFGCRIHGA